MKSETAKKNRGMIKSAAKVVLGLRFSNSLLPYKSSKCIQRGPKMISTKNLPKNWYILVGLHNTKGTILDTQIATSKSELYQKQESCKHMLPKMRYYTYKIKKVDILKYPYFSYTFFICFFLNLFLLNKE